MISSQNLRSHQVHLHLNYPDRGLQESSARLKTYSIPPTGEETQYFILSSTIMTKQTSLVGIFIVYKPAI